MTKTKKTREHTYHCLEGLARDALCQCGLNPTCDLCGIPESEGHQSWCTKEVRTGGGLLGATARQMIRERGSK